MFRTVSGKHKYSIALKKKKVKREDSRMMAE